MLKKHISLIKILIDNEYVTAKTLAEFLHVSIRTIKNYIDEINIINPNLITSSHQGYQINKQLAKQILNQENNYLPQNSQEREKFLLNYLIKNNQKANIYDLGQLIYISSSTLKNDLNKIKKNITKHNLELIISGDYVQLKGLEKNKRKLLSNIIYDESNINFVNIDSIQKTFQEIDIILIKTLINEIIINKYHYFINDYSLINLILHIAISIDRIKNGNLTTNEIDQNQLKNLNEYQMLIEFSYALETEFKIKLSPAELYEMALLLISRTTNIDYKTVTKNNLELFIGNDCLNLVKNIINDIANNYDIDISESEFFIRFALHIHNLIFRAKNNYFTKNPLTNNIKITCPSIYDMAVHIANSINQTMNILINDDEIAYITFHLGSTLKAQKNLTQKIKGILYCPNYYDLNTNIYNDINTYFHNELLITNIITDESDLEKITTKELIIHTIPLKVIPNEPSILINIFFNQKDKNNLNNLIINILDQKRKIKFKNYLQQLIIPNFFEKISKPITKERCLQHLVNKLIKNKYVDHNFLADILNREAISSTAFNNFAIPHTLKMNAHKTGINILISQTPILWDNQSVQLVMMLCFSSKERIIFNEIYETLTMILSEPNNFKKIINCHDYEQFINLLTSLA